MSYGKPRFVQGLVAGADLSDDANIGKAVKVSTDNTVVLVAASTDAAIGTIHCGNAIGKFVEVSGNGGGGKGRIGAAVVAGAELMSNASGLLITATAGNRVVAIAMEAGAASGDLISIDVVAYNKV